MGEFAAKFRPDINLDEFERRLRAAAPGPQSRGDQAPQPPQAPDPLAELARLVGGEGRGHDPFEALFRAQAAIADINHAPERQSPDLHSHEPYFEDQAAPYGQHPQAHDFHAHGDEARSYGHQADASQFAAEPLPYGEAEPQWANDAPHAESWAGEASGLRADPAAPGGRRKVFFAMFAIIALGAVSIAATLAMRARTGAHEVVTIQADTDPARVKPEQADNSATDNSQALFNRTDNAAGAKVVGSAEQPADLGATVKAARAVGGPGSSVPDAPAPAAAAPTSQDAPFPQPKKVKTVSVRADGSLIDGADAKPQLARGMPNSLPSMAGMPPSGMPAAATPNSGGNKAPTTRSTDRAATSTTAAALKPPARPKPAKPAGEPEIAGDTGVYFVQLASSPLEADARVKANALSVKYASALNGRHATFVEGKKGDVTIYRVRVGHLTEDAAKQMCAAVKGQGGDCYVAKN